MPLMGFANLSVKLGELILNERKLPYEEVLHTDFTVDWFNGTEVTPGESDYQVRVHYLRDVGHGDTTELVVTKTYRSMSDIVNELSDIEDDVRFD